MTSSEPITHAEVQSAVDAFIARGIRSAAVRKLYERYTHHVAALLSDPNDVTLALAQALGRELISMCQESQ